VERKEEVRGKREEAGPKIGTIEIRACGCTVQVKCLKPARAAAGADVLGTLDRHARKILEELTGCTGKEVQRPGGEPRTGNPAPEAGTEGGAE